MRSFVVSVVVLMLLSGCATTRTVDQKIAEVQARQDEKIENVETQVEDLQTRSRRMESQIEELGQSAAEALRRAQEAGVLAQGKVVFQQTFAEDKVRFPHNSFNLTPDARAALDQFAARVKDLGRAAYMEIQGHTDDTGRGDYNDMLGQLRAETVRRYLSRNHALPLGRMATISYGDTLPVGSNRTREGRAQNRRVVIVVLE